MGELTAGQRASWDEAGYFLVPGFADAATCTAMLGRAVELCRAGARGEPLGTTPFDLSLPDSNEPLVLLFWKKGYAPREVQVIPHGDVTLNVQLGSMSSGSSGKKKSGGSTVDKRTTIDPFN